MELDFHCGSGLAKQFTNLTYSILDEHFTGKMSHPYHEPAAKCRRLWEGIAYTSVRSGEWHALVLTNRSLREMLGIHTFGIPAFGTNFLHSLAGSLPKDSPFKHVNQIGSVKLSVAKAAPCVLTDTDLRTGWF
jgi:hypothetical protein